MHYNLIWYTGPQKQFGILYFCTCNKNVILVFNSLHMSVYMVTKCSSSESCCDQHEIYLLLFTKLKWPTKMTSSVLRKAIVTTKYGMTSCVAVPICMEYLYFIPKLKWPKGLVLFYQKSSWYRHYLGYERDFVQCPNFK